MEEAVEHNVGFLGDSVNWAGSVGLLDDGVDWAGRNFGDKGRKVEIFAEEFRYGCMVEGFGDGFKWVSRCQRKKGGQDWRDEVDEGDHLVAMTIACCMSPKRKSETGTTKTSDYHDLVYLTKRWNSNGMVDVKRMKNQTSFCFEPA